MPFLAQGSDAIRHPAILNRPVLRFVQSRQSGPSTAIGSQFQGERPSSNPVAEPTATERKVRPMERRSHSRDFCFGQEPASSVGACPGDQESAEVSYSHRSPKGSRHMRRISQSSRQRCGQDEREYFSDRVSPSGAGLRTPSNYRSHCSSPLPADLVDSSSERALRRARSVGQSKVAISVNSEDDPTVAKTRLSG